MQRRSFLKNTLLTATGVLVLPYLGNASELSFPLLTDNPGLLQAPDECRPWCYWMWMNGNITKAGITLDLEAMKKMGIGGAIAFNNAVGIPRGPVDYGSEEWMDIVYHTASEADRLGIELTLQNSPGYSGCGGPWVTPEMSMQQLMWSETLVSGEHIGVTLPRPFARQGYYRDAFVIAYPSLRVEKALMNDHLISVKADGRSFDKQILWDGDPESKIRIEPQAGKPASLVLEFDTPFEARAISLTRRPETPVDLFDGPRDIPPNLKLEYSDDGISYQLIGTVRCPELRAMDTPAALSFDVIRARYYRLISETPTWISGVELYNGPRLGGWPGKTNYTHGDSMGLTPKTEQDLIIEPGKVIDITDHINDAGHLKWQAPGAGNWTILRIGHTTTGEEPAAHPDTASGLEIDKLRRDALDFHFEHFLDKVISKLKPFIGKSFKGFMCDSWEAGKQNWSIHFPDEFKRLRGYDILNWLPALTGRIVGSVGDTERFLWDFRKTHCDLLSQNFYGYFQECSHRRGLNFIAEPYGDGTFDSLQSGQYLDVPTAEFWSRYIYGSDVTSKSAAATAHVYGRKVAAAEAFTGMPANSHWADYPYSLKAEGDYFFTLGINRLVFHTFVHQPYLTGRPGMTMGPFGSHFDRNNTWTEQAYPWTNYLTRTQHLLQQGIFVADACYFKGDEPTQNVPDTYQFMPPGHIADAVGTDALTRFKIIDGKITMAGGMSYQVCIMANTDTVLLPTIGRLKALVADGMTLIVSSKPTKTFGRQYAEKEVLASVAELYGDLDGSRVKERRYGKGKVIWTDSIAETFSGLGLAPDFIYTAEKQDAAIHYVHKRLDDLEYYFITNHRRRTEKIQCSLRVSGIQPELWNTGNGKMSQVMLYESANGRTDIALELEPAGSIFIVCRKKATSDQIVGLYRDGEKIASTKPYPILKSALYADIQNNFTIHLWAKPDSFAQAGKSMLFHAGNGDALYGEGHAAAALSAGQNGIRVYERSKRQAVVLTTKEALQGWTHIALVYDGGKPLLYVNGRLSATARASGLTIHPGIDTPVSPDQYSSFFEGSYTAPILDRKPLPAGSIMQIYRMGLPAPELYKAMDISKQLDGKLNLLAWKNGNYVLEVKGGAKFSAKIDNCQNNVVSGPWQLRFPPDSGVPATVELPHLISLSDHDDFDIKHFSGTLTYQKTIFIGASELAPGKKIFLDLGRVEVVAEVKVNGKLVDALWKEPFLLDITDALKAGNNHLEIAVTTLFANRLIGDEHLPEENAYTKDGPIKKLPGWYINNQSKPGKRKTFSVWHNLEKDSPLLASGLLGPVQIITAIHHTIN